MKIQSNPAGTQAGSFGYGSFSGSKLIGGIPFTSRPDSFAGYFAYHIAAGDTASVYLVLKKSGNVIGSDTLLIWGTNTGFYSRKKARINYRSAGTPDSLMLIVTATNIRHVNPSSYLLADNLGFVPTSISLPNGDFESWYSRSYLDPIGWTSENSLGLTTGEYPVTDTSNHFGGRLGAKLKNINQGSYYQLGYLYIGKQGSKGILPGISVNQVDTFFTGYYKFFPKNNDTCTFAVSMFRHDSLVGSGQFYSKDTVSSWTPFVVPITYIPSFTGTPDSAAIQIAAYKLGSKTSPRGNSILMVDDVSFNTFSTAISELSETALRFSIAPNPFSDYTLAQFEMPVSETVQIKLYDFAGREMKSYPATLLPAGKQSLRISSEGLAPGMYLLVLNGGTIFKTQKLVVVR